MSESAAQARWLRFLLAATVFLGAWLLFLVQPLVSNFLLPWFGGGPAVWTTCLLFFQAFLLAGYLYAHLTQHWLSPRRQAVVHALLIAAAMALLPVLPGDAWKPAASDRPTLALLVILAACVGLPYLVLATTGPLVQAWFARTFPDRSPYRLYALSNAGSLLALLSYPLLVEPALAMPDQSWWWSAGFITYGLLCGSVGLWVALRGSAGAAAQNTAEVTEVTPPSLYDYLRWLALPALASLMLLATTNHVCQNVAPVPLLWVLPLALYLISFIVAFDHPRWYRPWIVGFAALLLIYAAVGIEYIADWHTLAFGVDLLRLLSGNPLPQWNADPDWTLQLTVHFAALFALCLVCHGELARLKPHPQYLTHYYLMIAAGGALGGLLVSVIAPLWFSSFLEWKLGLFVGFVVAMSVVIHPASFQTKPGRRFALLPALTILVGLLACAMVFDMGRLAIVERPSPDTRTLEQTRNFYGVLRVVEEDISIPRAHMLAMYNGQILHGCQFLQDDRRRLATTYYATSSAVGLTLKFYEANPRLRVGAIGLGVGTLAAYAEAGQTFRFYEINPETVRLAETYFTYLRDAHDRGATVEVVLGDARLSLEREREQNPDAPRFDVLIVDAFSGDAIPHHLMTLEAVKLYLRRLSPQGTIAMHTSNRHLQLSQVVHAIARKLNLSATTIISAGNDRGGVTSAEWVILTRHQPLTAALRAATSGNTQPDPDEQLPLWTDQHHNLFEILK